MRKTGNGRGYGMGGGGGGAFTSLSLCYGWLWLEQRFVCKIQANSMLLVKTTHARDYHNGQGAATSHDSTIEHFD